MKIETDLRMSQYPFPDCFQVAQFMVGIGVPGIWETNRVMVDQKERSLGIRLFDQGFTLLQSGLFDRPGRTVPGGRVTTVPPNQFPSARQVPMVNLVFPKKFSKILIKGILSFGILNITVMVSGND